MSDLISRSELIRRIESEYREYGEDYDAEQILGDIEDMPTVYDINNVVEELKCDRCESCNFLELCAGSKCCGKCHEKAIEIVKHGGVSDDVCEWKLEDDNLMTGCGDYFNLYDNCTGKFKYCPRCGKKIKIVGD